MGYRKMLNEAAALHVGNADETRLIEPLGLTALRTVIPNGVFLEEIEPLPAPGMFRTVHPEVGDRPFVLFLSRLHYKKGLSYLTDAFAQVAPRLPDARLVVAAPDEGEREPFVQRIAATALLSERVHLVGPLYGRDKYAVMADATCFCLPSHQEGAAWRSSKRWCPGLPAIISEGCHFPGVAEGSAGEVLPLDAGAFAQAMERTLVVPAAHQRMAEAGRRLIESRYKADVGCLSAGCGTQGYERVAQPVSPALTANSNCGRPLVLLYFAAPNKVSPVTGRKSAQRRCWSAAAGLASVVRR